jgi:hypothetical protein
MVIVVRVSDDDRTTRTGAPGTIHTAGTDHGLSVWRDSDQREECEQSERKRFHFFVLPTNPRPRIR